MPFFNELREPNLMIPPNNRSPPPLFNFKPQELFEHPPGIKNRLIPEWYTQQA